MSDQARVLQILLVEDNPGDCRLMQAMLAEAGRCRFELINVPRLAEAVAFVRTHHADVVLLDLSLPDAHGVDVVLELKKVGPDLPILVLTGNDDETIAIQALQLGAEDYLVKSQIDGHMVTRAIRYAIERKRSEENAIRLVREQAARAKAEAAERASRFLAEASRVLGASLDYEVTLASIARLAVPEIADFCFIDVESCDGEFQRAGAAHGGAENDALVRALQRFAPSLRSEHAPNDPVVEVLRTRRPLIIPEVDREHLCAMAACDEHRILMESLSPASFMSVPLIARGRTLGAMSFFASKGSRRYSDDALSLAAELGGRAALAVDNARLYRESQRLYREAQQATAVRDEVLAVVSHDLRNPLNVITVAAALMRQDAGQDERRLKQIEKVERSASRMNRLIEDLLDVTRIDAGGLPIEPVSVRAEQIVNEAFELLRPLAEEKSLRLEVQLAPDLPPLVADRHRVVQVFSNLVGNAIKFTPSGGRITICSEGREQGVCFAVRDTGPGILQENLERIFDRFWQGPKAERYGAGLGLAIAKGIVEAHEGRIWVESEVGFGATFYFTLPAVATQRLGDRGLSMPISM